MLNRILFNQGLLSQSFAVPNTVKLRFGSDAAQDKAIQTKKDALTKRNAAKDKFDAAERERNDAREAVNQARVDVYRAEKALEELPRGTEASVRQKARKKITTAKAQLEKAKNNEDKKEALYMAAYKAMGVANQVLEKAEEALRAFA